MRDQDWQDYHIKDGHKGPIIWRVKAARFRLNVCPQGAGRSFTIPSAPAWLIYAEHPVTGEIKYFVSNAPATTPVTRILHVAFSRWHIERCFQDEKGLLGLDHFEVRRFRAIQRHLIITAISHLFLARTKLKLETNAEKDGKKKPDTSATSARDRGLRSSETIDSQGPTNTVHQGC